jgi:hypothetical protein
MTVRNGVGVQGGFRKIQICTSSTRFQWLETHQAGRGIMKNFSEWRQWAQDTWRDVTGVTFVCLCLACALTCVRPVHSSRKIRSGSPSHFFQPFPMFLTRSHGRILSARSFLRTTRFHSCPVWLAPKLEKFKLADIGEGITECEVISWYVKAFAQTTMNLSRVHVV